MGAGHIAVNILVWTCTFDIRPKFENRPALPFWPVFLARLYPYEFFDFSLKMKVEIFGIFSIKPVLGSPDHTINKVLGPSEHRLLHENEREVGLGTLYFNKFLPSIFRQVRRWEQVILPSTY